MLSHSPSWKTNFVYAFMKSLFHVIEIWMRYRWRARRLFLSRSRDQLINKTSFQNSLLLLGTQNINFLEEKRKQRRISVEEVFEKEKQRVAFYRPWDHNCRDRNEQSSTERVCSCVRREELQDRWGLNMWPLITDIKERKIIIMNIIFILTEKHS